MERVGAASDLEHRPAADELEAEPEELALGSAVGMAIVVVACVLLAVLPVAVALQAPAPPGGWVATSLGSLAAVIFSFKLVAIAWGVAVRLWSAPRPRSHGRRPDEAFLV